jgi:NACHT domain
VVRSQRPWKRIAAWSGALAASAVLMLWAASLLNRNAKVAGEASMTIALAGLALTIWQLRIALRQGLPPSVAPVDDAARLGQAAEKLAKAVTDQWEAEAALRALRRPAPLQLAWSTTDRPVAAPAETIVGDTITGRAVRLRLHGHLDEVAEKFLALPHRRLVVLGEPGAGKTVLAMLLTLELLARRQPHQPVPVLLSLSSWNPTSEHLHTWVARRLGEDYRLIAAQQLVTGRRVLPILDGLDELPEPLRPTAIGELDRARANRPLVLTCRSQEYQQAVAAGGGALAAAAVVELQPVTAAEAIAFLWAAAAPAPERWDRVAAHLHTAPDGALAAALSTPLMVALARTIYASPGRDPSELVGLAQAGGQAAVEGQLLEEFIPAAFAAVPPAPGIPAAPRRRWDPESAKRWLTVLATHLRRHRTRDLAWWQLPRLVPQRARRRVVGPGAGLLVALLLGLLVGLLVGLPGGVMAGIVAGLLVALPGGAVLGATLGVALAAGPLTPTRVDIRRWRRLRDLSAARKGDRMTFARELGSKIERAVGRALGLVIWLSIALGLVALAGGFVIWRDRLGLAGRLDARDLLGLAFAFGLGLAFWFWVARDVGGAVAFVFGLMEWLRSPADDARAVTPWSVFRDDRTAAIVLGLVGGLLLGPIVALIMAAGWLLSGREPGLLSELGFGLALGLAVGLLGGLAGGLGFAAWGQFTIVRAWLAVRGQLPWRLMAFLNDAHQRGVLRQAGAVYQFRHARLQDHLADTSPASQTDR